VPSRAIRERGPRRQACRYHSTATRSSTAPRTVWSPEIIQKHYCGLAALPTSQQARTHDLASVAEARFSGPRSQIRIPKSKQSEISPVRWPSGCGKKCSRQVELARRGFLSLCCRPM
jgi:hypothetical protein